MKKDRTHELIMFGASSNAILLAEHYDNLPEDDRKKMVIEMCYAVRELMAFRNIINGMVPLKEPVRDAARQYLED